MNFAQFGSPDGRLVVYFHGAPGAPEECRVFESDAKRHALRFICLDRFAIDAAVKGEAYFKRIAEEILSIANGKQVDFVGFSIGAFVALQTTRYMGGGVRRLYLVSAAAPLEAGDYLDAMAGKQVFKLARAWPVLFILLSYWQALLAWCFPKALFNLLFASAVGKDKVLAGNAEFQSRMIAILRWCFVGRVRGYARDVIAYVQPWAATLADLSVGSGIGCNTHIWHGSEDNWSPVQMADDLQLAIGGSGGSRGSTCTIIDGASHYSCLYEAMPAICGLLGEGSLFGNREGAGLP